MEVSFDVEKEHLKDFSLYNVKNSAELQKMVKIQTFITPLIFLVFTSIMGIVKQDLATWTGVFMVVYAIWIIGYPKWYIMSVKKNIAKDIDGAAGDKELVGHCKLTLTEKDVIEESNARVHNTKYKDLGKLVEVKEYVFLFNSENSGYVIPKESFENKDHQEKFIKMLENKTHKKAEQWK